MKKSISKYLMVKALLGPSFYSYDKAEKDKYDLHSKFNLELHKKTFVNYLEVCIDEEGNIHYAIPSHQEFLINYACKKRNISRKKLNDLCPIDYYADFVEWLCQITNSIAVWNFKYMGNPNEKQKETLQLLINEGLLTINENGKTRK